MINIVPSASEGTTASELKPLVSIYPEDVNRKQIFDLPETPPVQELKLVFEESSDFFGRITIYDLQIMGFPTTTEDCP